jgi:hypothetical protein
VASIRVQLTTYLSTPEQIAEWETVKGHFTDARGDAEVLRAIDDIRHEVRELRTDVEAIKNLIGVLCEKVGVNV